MKVSPTISLPASSEGLGETDTGGELLVFGSDLLPTETLHPATRKPATKRTISNFRMIDASDIQTTATSKERVSFVAPLGLVYAG